MGLTHPTITNFSGGQVSPLMAGRVDLDTHGTMLDTLENMLVQRQGGVTKRMGTYYIQALADSSKEARLIPFEFSTTQAYILEFSNLTMRVYKDGGIVMDGANPYSLVTPYSDSEVADLRFVQSADTMFIVHPDHMPRELTRTAHDAWTITAITPVWGPFLDENESTVTMTPSGVTGAITLTASASTFSVGNAGFTTSHVGSLFKISGLEEATASITAQATWTDALELDAGETVIVSISGTWVATVTLQRSFDDGSTWVDYITYTSNASTEIIESRDDVQYRLGVDTGDFTSGTIEVSIAIPEQEGYVQITQRNSATSVNATVVEKLPSASAVTTWSEGAWSDLRGYPSSIAFFELRLVFAGTSTHPQTIWASVVDDFTNFEAGSDDDDAWLFQLAAENVNVINSLVVGEILYILTAGGEWRIGNTDGTATTPTNVEVKRESAYGSLATQARKAGHAVLFPQRGGRRLRMMLYNYRVDGWQSHDISFFAEDLFQEGMSELIVVKDPDDIVWIRLSDGTLVACTYDLVNTTFAYTKHEIAGTGAEVESIATIPGSNYDEVWLLVKRTINGSTVRYVEQMQSPIWSNHKDAVFMDSTITYDASPTTSLSGLDHLEGETVDILADGMAHAQETVASGAIALDYSASTVHVGYAYTAKLKTQKLEQRTATGSSQAQPIDSMSLTVRLNQSIGMEVSTDDSSFEQYSFRDPNDEMDTAIDTFTGDTREIELEPVDDYRSIQLSLRNEQPFPFTVLGLFPVLRT